nr:MAG TPA: hypothetical protein [Caudoviricetes sp.]
MLIYQHETRLSTPEGNGEFPIKNKAVFRWMEKNYYLDGSKFVKY